MALIKKLKGVTPTLGEGCFVAETAVLIGDVVAGNNCSFWYNTVVRGDVNTIRIGDNVNIQDGAVIHCNYKDSVTVIGDNVSIGHNAIVHGAEVGNNVLIGMGAIIMDHARIGDNSVIAAGCVITKHMVIEPGSVYGGIPAVKIKSYDPAQLGRMTVRSAEQYRMYLDWYREAGKQENTAGKSKE